MPLQLTDEQSAIRSTAREFCTNEIAPRSRDADRAERFDPQLAERLGEMGYIGALVDVAFGGSSLDYLTYGLIVEELGRVDSSARTIVSVGTSLVATTLESFGSEEQKQRWLPGLCAGKALGCFALTEPDSGSDAAGMRTRAVPTGGAWEITGQKMWISLASQARFALVFAKTDFNARARGITCFLVPTDTDGFKTQKITGKLGLRASDVAEVLLDAVRVPADAVVGEIGSGFRIAMSALRSGRFSVAAGAVGICQAALDASVAYATERHQFGRPIASFQLVQQMLSKIATDTNAARLLTWQAAYLKDTGQPNDVETSMAKLFASEAAVRSADTAIQVHGGAGYVDDHPVERLWRDARVTTLYEGTSQIQELIIGRALTGLNALVPG